MQGFIIYVVNYKIHYYKVQEPVFTWVFTSKCISFYILKVYYVVKGTYIIIGSLQKSNQHTL